MMLNISTIDDSSSYWNVEDDHTVHCLLVEVEDKQDPTLKTEYLFPVEGSWEYVTCVYRIIHNPIHPGVRMAVPVKNTAVIRDVCLEVFYKGFLGNSTNEIDIERNFR